MLGFLLILAVPVTSVALLYARWEYCKRGKLSVLGLALLCAMLFIPNLILEYATRYELPSTLLDFVGLLVGGFGLVLCVLIFVRGENQPLDGHSLYKVLRFIGERAGGAGGEYPSFQAYVRNKFIKERG